jgi:hypothetical protein
VGVGRDEIAVQAFGESRPLVRTADGVRDPQNRGVEVVLNHCPPALRATAVLRAGRSAVHGGDA